jgi:hypothetical protein
MMYRTYRDRKLSLGPTPDMLRRERILWVYPILWALMMVALAVYSQGAHALDLMTFAPDTVGPEIEHMSHATQHAPLTSSPTDYGVELLSVVARWDIPRGFYLELAEGFALERHETFPGYVNRGQTVEGYGELLGPRESFSARFGWRWRVK